MTPTEVSLMYEATALPDWDFIEYRPVGALEGYAVMKGTEFHCTLFKGSPLRRTALREFLRPLYERHGHLTTRVAVGDTANERFNKLFGFERTWSDGQYHYFLMAELPFGKEKTCQLSQ